MKSFATNSVADKAIPSDGTSRSGWARRVASGLMITAVLVTGIAGSAQAGDAAATDQRSARLDVQFTDCSELASITTISVAKARTVVPASFTPAGDASGVPFVVRVADCRAVSIDAGAPEPAIVAQLGVSIVSPDGTGDINNYSAWYYTTSKRLAVALRHLGVPAQWVPRLGFHVTPSSASTGSLTIDVAAGRPAFLVSAPVVEPGPATVPFQANWWTQSGTQRTKMGTALRAVRFGSATATLTTPRYGRLGRLLGGSTATFALLDSYNRFADAQMIVSARP